MHSIEPHYNWRHLYIASEDERSPFYGYLNSEVHYTDTIYNFVIHPQWDFIGCETLYLKLLFANYDQGYAIIEIIGEWNDVLHNDIMFLKRELIEPLMAEGISKFIFLGDNLLNFHAGEVDYYEEWFEELSDGWIVAINFRKHILSELSDYNIDQYIITGNELDHLNWRNRTPQMLFRIVSEIVKHRLG